LALPTKQNPLAQYGERELMLQAQSACNISTWNEDCTSRDAPVSQTEGEKSSVAALLALCLIIRA
jgi:hypothetical protein